MSVCHLASHCTDADKISYPFCFIDSNGVVTGLGLLSNRKNTEQGARTKLVFGEVEGERHEEYPFLPDG